MSRTIEPKSTVSPCKRATRALASATNAPTPIPTSQAHPRRRRLSTRPWPPPGRGASCRIPLQGGHELVLPGHEGPIIALAFSPDGARVATRDLDGVVHDWDVKTGIHHPLAGPSPSTKALSSIGLGALYFSPDSAALASVGEDESLRLWDVRSGAIRVLQGHEGRILSAAFSPDGTALATGGYDRTVRLWSVSTGKSRVLHEFEDAVITVAFSPDGEHLAAGGADATVRIFSTSMGADRVLSHPR